MTKNPHKTIKVVGDKVAVEFLKEPDVTPGGIQLPNDRPLSVVRHAVVRFIGSDISEEIDIGDTVIVDICKSSPKFKFNDKELRLYDCKDIIAVIY